MLWQLCRLIVHEARPCVVLLLFVALGFVIGWLTHTVHVARLGYRAERMRSWLRDIRRG